jgi:hypothetical protein
MFIAMAIENDPSSGYLPHARNDKPACMFIVNEGQPILSPRKAQ